MNRPSVEMVEEMLAAISNGYSITAGELHNLIVQIVIDVDTAQGVGYNEGYCDARCEYEGSE